MRFLDNIKKVFLPTKYSKGTINTTNVPDYDPVSDFGGSRTTLPKFIQVGRCIWCITKEIQRELQLDDFTLSTMGVDDLIDTLIDAHPDVSFAVWNFMNRDSGTPLELLI